MHNQREEAHVDKYGYSIPPGRKAFATLRKKQFELQTEPWGECVSPSPDLEYSNAYTLDACLSGKIESYKMTMTTTI